MVWHFLTARSQARQREWERERARSNIENFEQYQSASAQWFFFGLPSLRQDVRAYDIRARLCGLRVNFFRDQLKGSVWQLGVLKCLKCLAFSMVWPVWHEDCMKHNGHVTCVTCVLCLFLVSALKFGKHAFECMLDLHVLFVSGKAGGFRNVGTISHLESLRATAPRFSPALPPSWNRQLGIIGLVRKSTAIHVDNCCIASGKGTMPVYPIAFEMDLVLARCQSNRGSCWGVKKQGHFVTFCYFGAPALWSILFVLWCIMRGGDAVVSFQEQHGMEPSLATPVSTFEFAKFALHKFTAMMIRRLVIWYLWYVCDTFFLRVQYIFDLRLN